MHYIIASTLTAKPVHQLFLSKSSCSKRQYSLIARLSVAACCLYLLDSCSIHCLLQQYQHPAAVFIEAWVDKHVLSMQKFAEKPKGKDLDAMKVDTTVLGTDLSHQSGWTCILIACL